MPGRVEQFAMAEKFGVVGDLVVLERVGPCLLVLGHDMDLPVEEEHLVRTVVPPGACRKHAAAPPDIGTRTEDGDVGLGVELQVVGLDEHRIGVHVDVSDEAEGRGLRIVGSEVALDDLAVLVAEGSPVAEDGDAVLGVVVQVLRPQGVLVLVLELHDAAPELCKVVIDEIVQLVTGQDCPVLDDADVSYGLDDVGVDIPQGSVAEQLGRVVLETGIAAGLPVADPEHLHLAKLVAAEEPHQGVLLLLLLRECAGAGKQHQQHQQ